MPALGQSPTFFPRGPKPLTRLIFFVVLSLILLFIDARYRYLEEVRYVVNVALYPLQRLANWPSEAMEKIAAYFAAQQTLRNELEQLQQQILAGARAVQVYESLRQENQALRALLQLSESYTDRAVPAQVFYLGRDPFSQKLFVDKGGQQGIKAGQAVIDAVGVIGQITRVFPWHAEVTQLTEKDHVVPVKIERTGLRSVLYGAGGGRPPELRFISTNADIQPGDILTTSGLDDVYPPGLKVATVESVERDTGHTFARIAAKPVAGIARSQQLLILNAMPARLPLHESITGSESGSRKSGKPRRRE